MRVRWIAMGVVTVMTCACGLQEQTQPSLIGPAEGGLAITMTALPDSLPRDGSSQSVVTLTARDSQGRAVGGQRLSLSLGTNAPQGATISASEVVTSSTGQASFAVGAPVAGSIGDITVNATPVGSDANNIPRARQISIRALPQNNTLPQFPSPPFSVTCASLNGNCTTDPEVGQVVTFDATGVTDENVTCNSCLFTWNFGGEGTASGQIVSHVFGSPGTFVVTLTVTDAGGLTNSAQRNLTVTAPGPATVSINAPVPDPPIAGQAATFTATATAASGHRIVSYSWSWGDGTSSQTSSASIQHTYANYGPVLISLTVTDDLNQSSTAYRPITVSSGLTATLTWSPASPNVGQTVTFTATASSSVGSTITNYLFDFGDGTDPQSSLYPTAKHEYQKADAFVVKLTVTDDKGHTFTTAPQILQVP
jgi:large repetitive protein